MIIVCRRGEGGHYWVKYRVIGKNNVAVPSHFFKVVVGEGRGELDLEAYIMPNAPIDDKAPLEAFRVKSYTIINLRNSLTNYYLYIIITDRLINLGITSCCVACCRYPWMQ